MNVETLIYAYLAICTGMIIFNLVCIFAFRQRDKALHKRSSKMEAAISKQLRRVHLGEEVEEAHKAFLKRKLMRTGKLMAFDDALEKLKEQFPEDCAAYIKDIHPVFVSLAGENRYSDPMRLSYFAYVIRKYDVVNKNPSPAIMEFLIQLLQQPSLYCRENSLQAIYTTGDCEYVLRALHIVDENPMFHHPKLLTDGLLNFGGDRGYLFEALWNAFDSFSVSMQLVILDCIRFGGGDMKEEFLQILADGHKNDELRFSCIRYFGKYAYEPAFPILIDFVERPSGRRWEYAAIAATSLTAYPGKRTVDALKSALGSPNWYVRFNAAKSLENFRLTYLELSDVLDSNDRYAREILQYRMDIESAQRQREAVTV